MHTTQTCMHDIIPILRVVTVLQILTTFVQAAEPPQHNQRISTQPEKHCGDGNISFDPALLWRGITTVWRIQRRAQPALLHAEKAFAIFAQIRAVGAPNALELSRRGDVLAHCRFST